MTRTLKYIYASLFILIVVCCSCTKHLEKLNENPNGTDPANANPNLVLPTVLTEAGRAFTNLGFGDIAGVMQYTQKDGWSGGHNNYDWGGTNDWSNYYAILRNNEFVYQKALASGDELLEGISLVMRSLMFGLLSDIYGDVPYTASLQGEKGGQENTFPVYQDQQFIYMDILSNLDKANTLLSKSKNDYSNNIDHVDVYFQGNPGKWRKFANSLALRYYMRLSEKLPDVAREGIQRITSDPTGYPIITAAAEDAAMSFPGDSQADSWPTNVTFDSDDASTYRRIKMADTFVRALLELNDPRIGIWADKVQIFLLEDDAFPPGTDRVADTVVNGEDRKVRYISQDVLSLRGLTVNDINQDPNYVGLPTALTLPQGYNLSTDLNQAAKNPHVSWLNDIYQGSRGPLLLSRLISAAEVQFILAEAALRGWVGIDPEAAYNSAIRASFDAWGIGVAYEDYISQPEVRFDGSQKQIITQKWIANWSNATEAWFDFRRTGYPELQGVQGQTLAPMLPIRLYYPLDEQRLNSRNLQAAADKLETTPYSGFGANGSKNSPWSRMWLLQGTGKPW